MRIEYLKKAAQDLGYEPFLVSLLNDQFLAFNIVSTVTTTNNGNTLHWEYPVRVMIGYSGDHVTQDDVRVFQVGGETLHPHIKSGSEGNYCFGDNWSIITRATKSSDISESETMLFLMSLRRLINMYTSGAYGHTGARENDACYCLTGSSSSRVCQKCLVTCAATHRLFKPHQVTMIDGYPVALFIADLLEECVVCKRKLAIRGRGNVCAECKQKPCSVCGRVLSSVDQCEVRECILQRR